MAVVKMNNELLNELIEIEMFLHLRTIYITYRAHVFSHVKMLSTNSCLTTFLSTDEKISSCRIARPLVAASADGNVAI